MNNPLDENRMMTTLSEIRKQASQKTLKWIQDGTQSAGTVMTYVGNLPFVRPFAGALRLDWLVGISNNVDLATAEADVKALYDRHPNETPGQIAHRVIIRKSLQAGGIGLVSSLLPGLALPFLAVDVAATTALQTEMVYQIASAYGMDLSEPERKGEVLGIFGLALGGRNALKAGMGFLRNLPIAGAAIGAGTNATMLYSLGYAACRFYEAKLKTDANQPTDDILKQIHEETESYIDQAIAQQDIIDKILVHLILASFPDKAWDDILPELETLQLDPGTLSTIAVELKSPEPLDPLIHQLDSDFAVALLTQCRHIARSNGSVSAEEQKIISALEEKCEDTVERIT